MRNLLKQESGITVIALLLTIIIVFSLFLLVLNTITKLDNEDYVRDVDSSALLDIDQSLGLDYYIEKTREEQLKDYDYPLNDSAYVLAKDSDFELVTDGINIMTKNRYRYIGNDEYVIVPNTINGKKQVDANGMFMANSNIKGVKFEEGYENFVSTFTASSSIQEVVFPKSSKNLTKTFENCKELAKTPLHPDSVTTMYSTYSGCEKLVYVAPLPLNVESLNSTFSSCKSLKTAPLIPASAKDISDTFLLTPITGNLVCGIKDPNNLKKSSLRTVQYTNIPLTIYVPNSVVEKWKSIVREDTTTIIGI